MIIRRSWAAPWSWWWFAMIFVELDDVIWYPKKIIIKHRIVFLAQLDGCSLDTHGDLNSAQSRSSSSSRDYDDELSWSLYSRFLNIWTVINTTNNLNIGADLRGLSFWLPHLSICSFWWLRIAISNHDYGSSCSKIWLALSKWDYELSFLKFVYLLPGYPIITIIGCDPEVKSSIHPFNRWFSWI